MRYTNVYIQIIIYQMLRREHRLLPAGETEENAEEFVPWSNDQRKNEQFEAIAVIWVQWNKTKKWKMLFWRLPVRFLHVKRISFSPLKCFWIWKRICLKNFESHNTLSYRPVKRGKNYSQVSKTNLIPSWDVSNSKCLYLCLNNCKPHGMKVKTNHLRNSKAWSIHARTF